jgi:hypothetical protein
MSRDLSSTGKILWFSPSEELRTAEAVMIKNMQAMQDGSTT